jgi:hypothetical protein
VAQFTLCIALGLFLVAGIKLVAHSNKPVRPIADLRDFKKRTLKKQLIVRNMLKTCSSTNFDLVQRGHSAASNCSYLRQQA